MAPDTFYTLGIKQQHFDLCGLIILLAEPDPAITNSSFHLIRD